MLRRGALRRLVSSMWTLREPVEKVILDNEEKSTTYTETGDTGLLLGTVKLPAPKNHLGITFIIAMSFEGSWVGNPGSIDARFSDGVTAEASVLSRNISGPDWYYAPTNVLTYHDPTTYSLKGSTSLEIRVYLVGAAANPTAIQHCRNLVVTVVPLYK